MIVNEINNNNNPFLLYEKPTIISWLSSWSLEKTMALSAADNRNHLHQPFTTGSTSGSVLPTARNQRPWKRSRAAVLRPGRRCSRCRRARGASASRWAWEKMGIFRLRISCKNFHKIFMGQMGLRISYAQENFHKIFSFSRFRSLEGLRTVDYKWLMTVDHFSADGWWWFVDGCLVDRDKRIFVWVMKVFMILLVDVAQSCLMTLHPLRWC